MSNASAHSLETLTLGGGCFWCTEAIFERTEGVQAVESGYAGGHIENPTYSQVCSGSTGHAEVIRITYDPAKVSLGQLLDLFWKAHDPTTLNQQGADKGTQYRSIILYANEAQQQAAENSKIHAQSQFKHPIVTEIVPLKVFYPAESDHQDFYTNHPEAGYCQFVIAPKLEKLGKKP